MDIREMIRKCEILHFPLMWICSAQASWFLFYAFLKVLTSKEVGLGLSFVVTLISIAVILVIAYESKFSLRIKLVTPIHSFISVTLILRIVRQLNGNGRFPLWEEWIFTFVFLSALLVLYFSPIGEDRRYEWLLSYSLLICLSTRVLMIGVDPWSSLLIEQVIFVVLFVTYSALNIPKGRLDERMIPFPLTIATFMGMFLGMFVFVGVKLAWLRFSGPSWGLHGIELATFYNVLALIIPWLLYIEYNRGRDKIESWN